MAKYNREFLVPYLQNICALQLLRNKVWEHCYKIQRKERQIAQGTHNHLPTEPVKDSRTGAGGFLIACGIILFCILFWSFYMNSIYPSDGFERMRGFVVFVLGGFGAISIFWGFSLRKSSQEEYERRYHKYRSELERYRQIRQTEEMKRATIPLLQKERAGYEAECRRIDDLLEQAYNVNIIPRQYRNIYAAVYLYDWFSTSGSDDMDMALNMFVLEEIKEKLDTIIRNQYDMLMNQQIMIANQRKSIEQQQSYERMMRQKLDQIQATQEEQVRYLGMIESETSCMAYLSAADYIRNI